MNQWEGIVIFRDLKMNAMVQCQWPSSCASMEGWNGGGLSDNAWLDHPWSPFFCLNFFAMLLEVDDEGRMVRRSRGFSLPWPEIDFYMPHFL